MAIRLFETTEHTALYAKYRFPVSEEIITPIINYMSKSLTSPYDIVVDVGCGSGQTAKALCKFFNRYVGVDVSEGQINHAKSSPSKPENAEYHVGISEEIPFVKNSCVDLISASQCLHWFDQPRFFKEADRILKPGGVLAVYAYTRMEITSKLCTPEQNMKIEDARLHFYDSIDEYWDCARYIAKSEYKDVNFPFADVERIHVNDAFHTSFHFLEGFLITLSPYQHALKKNPEKAKRMLEEFRNEVKIAFGENWIDDETEITITRPYCMILCRKI